jgi:hypothetical protein
MIERTSPCYASRADAGRVRPRRVGHAARRRRRLHQDRRHRTARIRTLQRVGNLVALGIVAGVAFIAIAIMYWTVPPKDLPLSSFLGHESGVSAVHVKHGIASFLSASLASPSPGSPGTSRSTRADQLTATDACGVPATQAIPPLGAGSARGDNGSEDGGGRFHTAFPPSPKRIIGARRQRRIRRFHQRSLRSVPNRAACRPPCGMAVTNAHEEPPVGRGSQAGGGFRLEVDSARRDP